MSSQELRTFPSIVLLPENRDLPGESFSIQGVSKWIHSLLLRTTCLPRWRFSSQSLQMHFVELVALNRGGIVAPENEQRNNSLV